TAPSASAAAAPSGGFYAILGRFGCGGLGFRGRDRHSVVDHGGARRGPARLVDAHQALLAHVRATAGHRDDVAVDLGDRVVDVVHVRLDDVHEHLVALAEGHGALLDLLARALH